MDPDSFAADPNQLNRDDDEPMFGGRRPSEPFEPSTDDHFYALLNVPKNATDEQIQRSYRSLAGVFHPDKHMGEDRKKTAEEKFQAISRAYEVLSDPEKRKIYDLFGEEGLKITWEVAPRMKTQEELRSEYERMARRRREMDVENLLKAKSELTMTLDARQVFKPFTRTNGRPRLNVGTVGLGDRLKNVQVKQIFFKHSWESDFAPTTGGVYRVQMLTREGVGAGNVFLTGRHQFSDKLQTEISSTLLAPRIWTSKTTYAPTADSFVTVNGTLRTLDTPPPFEITVGQRVFAKTTGFFTFRSGIYTLFSWGSSLPPQVLFSNPPLATLGFTTGQDFSIQASLSRLSTDIGLSYGSRIASLGGVKVTMGMNVNTRGSVGINLNGERSLTENVKAGLGVSFNVGGGCTLRLRLSRLQQKLHIPIILSSDWDPVLVLTTVLVPTISYVTLHQLYLAPRKRRKDHKKMLESREERTEEISKHRRGASDAVRLLEDQVKRRVATEKAKDGLIIVDAHYGDADSIDNLWTPAPSFSLSGRSSVPTTSEPLIIDVSIPLQALVQNSQLVIPGGRSKKDLLGFYDPVPGAKKKLSIRYTFKGRIHELIVEDRAAVNAPMRAHLVSP